VVRPPQLVPGWDADHLAGGPDPALPDYPDPL
jgi:hypothetical protein